VFVLRKGLQPLDFGSGIKLVPLGSAQNLNVLYWYTPDKGAAPVHSHPQEQFGYIVKGSLKVLIDDQTAILKPGDAYFIPANVPHQFTAIGDTEAIDIFSPPRPGIPSVPSEPRQNKNPSAQG
jgi:quercetin dioxygenase-like cupin family protein